MDLLEYLQLKTGCEYISDLHLPEKLPIIRKTIKEIAPTNYSLAEWEDMVSYIMKDKIHFSNVEQARDYLKKYQVENEK